MGMADEELFWQVKMIILSVIPAREEVRKVVNNRFSIHESGKIIKFEVSVPWKDHLEDFENEYSI